MDASCPWLGTRGSMLVASLPQHIPAPPASLLPHFSGSGATRMWDICSLRHRGSPCTSQERMLQMLLLLCQLLNPAQAPAGVCLNSGNCTNVGLFLPWASFWGCFLKMLLAQSRTGLVQCHAEKAGLALLAPVHPPAKTLDVFPALEGFDAAGCGVPPCRAV